MCKNVKTHEKGIIQGVWKVTRGAKILHIPSTPPPPCTSKTLQELFRLLAGTGTLSREWVREDVGSCLLNSCSPLNPFSSTAQNLVIQPREGDLRFFSPPRRLYGVPSEGERKKKWLREQECVKFTLKRALWMCAEPLP